MLDREYSFSVESVRMVVVQCPSSVGDNVREMSSGHHVVLGQDVRADVAGGLTLARKRADPVEVVVLATAVRVVFHVFPDTVGDALELVLDVVGVEDRVQVAAELDPPEVVVFRVRLLVVELHSRDCGLRLVVVEVIVREW